MARRPGDKIGYVGRKESTEQQQASVLQVLRIDRHLFRQDVFVDVGEDNIKRRVKGELTNAALPDADVGALIDFNVFSSVLHTPRVDVERFHVLCTQPG